MERRKDESAAVSQDFRALRISLASPDDILSWSYGEVTKPETINYRRLRPEKDGLFCEAIFGPTRDYRCYCGKYKNIRYRGIVCEKCGVEVTHSSVRRERMGHVQLATPTAHLWYSRRVPNYLAYLLGITKRNLDRVLYFAQFVTTRVDEAARQKALKRLEETFEGEREQLESLAQDTIAALRERLAEEQAGVKDRTAQVRQQMNEELAAATEPIVEQAQALQRGIETRQGEQAERPLVFEPSGTVIVESGATIGREHLNRLNQVAQDHLSDVEADLRQRQQEMTEALRADLEQWQEATDEQVDRIERQLGQDIVERRDQVDDEREELLGLAELQFLGEPRVHELKSKWGQVFRVGMGAEAFHEILSNIDLDKLAKELWHEVRHGTSKQRRKVAIRRLRVVEALRKSDNRPEWMILTVLPIIPPDLRPMVQLDGGRFATSDLNDLYRRVINRNNRLKRLLELGAPDVIVRNEKRMLQEAVDSLIDNSQRGKALSQRGRRELKSLSDMLKGKKGRFRRNLLGKRVDYSGRSVIVVGPGLKMHQCGLPRTMALELYSPFVIHKLIEYNYATNVRSAKRLIERERPEVWEALEEVIEDRPVLLNRAPTLHRLGIQAFEPILVNDKAIHIHPLVCAAFNADFDGDQMAVHLPLSSDAVEEARKLMLAPRNLLKPADGQPVVGPTKDMCLGVYYLTMAGSDQAEVAPRPFVDLDEIEMAYSLGYIDLHTPVLVRQVYEGREATTEPIETTVGRCLFNRTLPDELRFIDRVMNKADLQELVGVCYRKLGAEVTTRVVDRIKDIGFRFATRSGVTIAISDLVIPSEKAVILKETEDEVAAVDQQYRRGLLTDDERYTRTIELWSSARERISEAVSESLAPDGPVAIMAKSGASKGGFGPIAQLAGMRGLMADPSGRIISHPIRSNLREGLTSMEYFISTHGSRKGLADTAMRTADAGYLTRRLVDVAQDIIINAHECGTTAGTWVRASDDIGGQTMSERLLGRIAAAPVVNPETGEVLAGRNEEIDEDLSAEIDGLGIQEVFIRSPMNCQLRQGICATCYGRDLGRGDMVSTGTAVGIVAAQSIGEPGTQLTLRTFHTGGVVHGGDITTGLPRIEEMLEARKQPKGEAPISEIGGTVHIVRSGDQRTVIVVDTTVHQSRHEIKRGWRILVEDGDEIREGASIASWHDEKEIVAEHGGRIVCEDRHVTIVREERDEREYEVPATGPLFVEEGQRIRPGHQLVEGVINPRDLLRIQGREAVEQYLLTEIQNVYRSQGVNINDKHFEVIIRRMLGKVRVSESGNTELLPGELIDRLTLEDINREMLAAGGKPAKAHPVLLGITQAALNTESFLSAASFQHTIRVLSNAAIEAKQDELRGLKENVIIGKLIPAGTGYRGELECSDGPIEAYEGIKIELPEAEEELAEAAEQAEATEKVAATEEAEVSEIFEFVPTTWTE